MFSRSLDYGAPSSQFYGHQVGKGYGTDSISLPLISPGYPSGQPSYGYTPTHQSWPVQNFHANRFEQPSNNYQIGTKLENNNFMNNFDNNKSGLLNQQKSHARNIKGRLLGDSDPTTEQIKHNKQLTFRQQLLQQIQQTKRRKQEEKQKIQRQQMQRQRKFYQGFKIQAQTKQNKDQRKDEKGYVMARTIHKFKKQRASIPEVNPPKKQFQTTNTLANAPKGRGKTYQNKSSLDNWQIPNSNSPKQASLKESKISQSSPKVVHRLLRMQQQIYKQKSSEEQRLSSLLLFQQRVLQKINDIKMQIKNTSFDVDNNKQIQRIRNNLRAKPIPFGDEFLSSNKKNNIDANHFYSLPLRQVKAPPTRYSVKLKDLSKQNLQQKNIKSEENQILNDKNVITNLVEKQQVTS